MAIYRYDSSKTLLDEIIKSNPTFVGLTPDQVTWHGLTVVSGANTAISFRGKTGSGWTGTGRVTYRRINIATLYSSTAAWAITMYNAKNLVDLLPRLNAKYGITLTEEDLTANTPITGATTQNITVDLTNSKMYYGSKVVTWTKGVMQLEDYYPQRTLAAFEKPVVLLSAYGHDFTPNATLIDSHDTSVPFSTASSTAVDIVDVLKSVTGLNLVLGPTSTPGTDEYDLSGFTLSRVNAWEVEEANQAYRKLAILTPPIIPGKQSQSIYLHYGLKQAISTASLVPVTTLDGLHL